MNADPFLPRETVAVLSMASTGMVVDALKMSGLQGAIPGIRPVKGFEGAKVIGPATTVSYAPVHSDTPAGNMYGFIRNSPPGSVLVVDGKGIDGHFVGDNMADTASRQGLRAVVVYGGARDLAGYRAIGMPLYCTGSATKPWPPDLQVTGHNVTLELGGVSVNPGDIIVADEDGVVAVPGESLSIVMGNLRVVIEAEHELEDAIKRDAPIAQILAALAKKRPKGK